MKFRFSQIFILFLVLSSCIKELEVDYSGYKPKVVLWAIVSLDSNITINISGNRGVKDEDTLATQTADILLYENDVVIKNLPSVLITGKIKVFDFGVKAQKNKSYKIDMKFTDKFISAQSKTSEKLSLTEIQLSKGDNAQLKYTIFDNSDFKEAYRFDVKSYYEGILYDTMFNKVIDSNYVYEKKFDKFDEPSLNYNIITSYQNDLQTYTFPVSDVLFNGKSKIFQFFVSNPVSNSIYVPSGKLENGLQIRNTLVCNKRYIVVKCLKISDEYYQFLITENKNNAIFGTSYYNPINLYSNVKGGLGLMCTQSERCDTVWVLK